MWNLLQDSTEKRTGDWFLSEYGTMIRLLGFTQSPYMSLTFLTPRFFSMEFIRQNLFLDIEHFLKYKKSTDIKNPWTVGLFTIKNKGSLPMVEALLIDLGFETKPIINYDPRQVISNKRKYQRINPFKHE